MQATEFFLPPEHMVVIVEALKTYSLTLETVAKEDQFNGARAEALNAKAQVASKLSDSFGAALFIANTKTPTGLN